MAGLGAAAAVLVTESVATLRVAMSVKSEDVERRTNGKYTSKFGLIRGRIGHILQTFLGIGYIIVGYSLIKNSHLRQKKVLSEGSNEKFRPEKIAKLLSKDDLDKTLNIYNKLMSNANKFLSQDNMTSSTKMISTLKSSGVDINQHGILLDDNMIRTNETLDRHGYSSSDFDKYRKIHLDIKDKQKKFTKQVLNPNWSIKSDYKMDRRALRILLRIVRRMSRESTI